MELDIPWCFKCYCNVVELSLLFGISLGCLFSLLLITISMQRGKQVFGTLKSKSGTMAVSLPIDPNLIKDEPMDTDDVTREIMCKY